MLCSKKGFSLTEIVVVVLIFGIGIGLFNTVFINNWSAYEDRIERANLWSEANQFFEAMSVEGRNAQLIAVTTTGNAKTAVFTNAATNTLTTFVITDTGELRRLKNAEIKIFGKHANFAQSNFTRNNRALIVELQLQEVVLNHPVNIFASTEILPRN